MPADVFLQIDGIEGESTDDKHQNWIEVLSFSHGVSQSGAGSRSSGGAASEGRCAHQDFSIVKTLDKASPELNLHCCNGKSIKKMKMELCRATGVSIGGGGGGIPTESVTFNYGRIDWVYVEMDHETGKKKGEVKKWWDMIANKGG
ncbi:MAG: Hcp family type VI secretion system effector [Planctomycetota bacterium]|jgi:type VI protein secretion system component Hcp